MRRAARDLASCISPRSTMRRASVRGTRNAAKIVLVAGVERAFLETGSEEDVDVLVAVAGAKEKATQLLERARPVPRLLAELPLGTGPGVFAFVQRPGGQLKETLADGMAVLAHEEDVVLIVEGDKKDRPRVLHHLPDAGGAIRRSDGIEAHVNETAGESALALDCSRQVRFGVVSRQEKFLKHPQAGRDQAPSPVRCSSGTWGSDSTRSRPSGAGS